MSTPSQPHNTTPGPFLEGTAWRWLLDLRSRLNVLVEVVGEQGQPLLPQVGGETAQRLRTALARVGAEAIDAATRRIGSDEPITPSQIDGLMFVAFVLDPDRRLRLVVAEPGDSTNRRAGQELAGVGEWLARSITSERAAQPGGSGVDANDWHELAVLHRLLNAAASSGSAREVVRLFVEAMAIWSDADVRAYIGDLSGNFALDVALASADATAAPPRLQLPSVAAGGVERISPERASDLGFSGGEPLVVARIHTTRTAPWLLAHLGPCDRRAEIRLAAFADILGPRLDAAAEVEASRLLWAMMQRLMITDAAAPTKGISTALRELSEIVPCEAALRILGPGGRVLLEAGDVAALAQGGSASGLGHLEVPLRTGAACTAVLILGASLGHALTLREQHLASVAASVLQTWIDGLLEKGLLLVERRRESSSTFDDLLARELNWARGERPVSFLLLAASSSAVTNAVTQDAIAGLRQHLRPFDAVGILASGQIGVWLPGVAREHASLIRNRLQDVLRAPGGLASLGEAAIGVATSTTPLARAADLVAAARADLEPRSGGGDR